MLSLSYSVQTESCCCRVQKQNLRIWRKPQGCYDKVADKHLSTKKNLQFQTTVKNLAQTRNLPHLLKWNRSITHHQGTHSHSFNLQFTITQRHSLSKSSIRAPSTENSFHQAQNTCCMIKENTNADIKLSGTEISTESPPQSQQP